MSRKIFIDKKFDNTRTVQSLKVPVYSIFPTPSGGERGNILYNTTDDTYYGCNGSFWFPLGGGGGGGGNNQTLEETLEFGNTTGTDNGLPNDIILTDNFGNPSVMSGQNLINSKGGPVTLKSGRGANSAGDVILNLDRDFSNTPNAGSLVVTKPAGSQTGVHIYAEQISKLPSVVTPPAPAPTMFLVDPFASDTCGIMRFVAPNAGPSTPFSVPGTGLPTRFSGYTVQYASPFKYPPAVVLTPVIREGTLDLGVRNLDVWVERSNTFEFSVAFNIENSSSFDVDVPLDIHYHVICPRNTDVVGPAPIAAPIVQQPITVGPLPTLTQGVSRPTTRNTRNIRRIQQQTLVQQAPAPQTLVQQAPAPQPKALPKTRSRRLPNVLEEPVKVEEPVKIEEPVRRQVSGFQINKKPKMMYVKEQPVVVEPELQNIHGAKRLSKRVSQRTLQKLRKETELETPPELKPEIKPEIKHSNNNEINGLKRLSRRTLQLLQPEPQRQTRQPEPQRQTRQPEPLRQAIQPEPLRQTRQPEPLRQTRQPEPPRQTRQPEPPRQARQPEPLRQTRQPEPPRQARQPEPPRQTRQADPVRLNDQQIREKHKQELRLQKSSNSSQESLSNLHGFKRLSKRSYLEQQASKKVSNSSQESLNNFNPFKRLSKRSQLDKNHKGSKRLSNSSQESTSNKPRQLEQKRVRNVNSSQSTTTNSLLQGFKRLSQRSQLRQMQEEYNEEKLKEQEVKPVVADKKVSQRSKLLQQLNGKAFKEEPRQEPRQEPQVKKEPRNLRASKRVSYQSDNENTTELKAKKRLSQQSNSSADERRSSTEYNIEDLKAKKRMSQQSNSSAEETRQPTEYNIRDLKSSNRIRSKDLLIKPNLSSETPVSRIVHK
jgi:hypothetical protein